MAKTHLKIIGIDARDGGQSEFDYNHQTACGYVRDDVTFNSDKVDCFYCLRSDQMGIVKTLSRHFRIMEANNG